MIRKFDKVASLRTSRSLFLFSTRVREAKILSSPCFCSALRKLTVMSSSGSKHSFKYIFLGGGNAAGYAARQFVALGGTEKHGGQLAIIGEEPHLSYERPALSKAYLFPENPARLPGFHTCVGGGGERQDMAWYQEHGIQFFSGTQVSDANIASKVLITSGGDEFEFEKLIIGTGSRAVKMSDFGTEGSNFGGIYYLRNIEDADSILAGVAAAKKNPRYGERAKVVCIGGGYIGLETAAGMVLNGAQVYMVFPESRVMERLFSPELSQFYEKYYENKGVTIIRNSMVIGFRGENGQVSHVQLKDGREIECDLTIVGIGARPNTELFDGKLQLLDGPPGGIKVDSNLLTSAPDIYAVGDVAAFPQIIYGSDHERQEHVQNARLSAAHAVSHMLGQEPGSYKYLPYFYSRIFDLSWVFYGRNKGNIVHFGDFNSRKFGAFWVQGGHVVGCFLEGGSPDENSMVQKIASAQPKAVENLDDLGLGIAANL